MSNNNGAWSQRVFTCAKISRRALSLFKKSYDIVLPKEVTMKHKIPDSIKTPEYFDHGIPHLPVNHPEKISMEGVENMRLSCKLAKKILLAAKALIMVGRTTDEIDATIHQLVVNNGAYPSPLHYRGFPKSICTSVNNVVCHGIPDLRPLQDGDIINVDITVFYNGYHGDCSATFLVGNVDESGMHLVEAAKKCMLKGISICKPGENLSSIGAVIEEEAEKHNINVIPEILGHGIGRYFHCPPDIYHFSNTFPGKMLPGMTFTIEPALTEGATETCILEDGWTCVTLDNSRAAQFEETILITENGVEILTQIE